MSSLFINLFFILVMCFLGYLIRKEKVLNKIVGENILNNNIKDICRFIGKSLYVLAIITLIFNIVKVINPFINDSIYTIIVVFWFVIVAIESQMKFR